MSRPETGGRPMASPPRAGDSCHLYPYTWQALIFPHIPILVYPLGNPSQTSLGFTLGNPPSLYGRLAKASFKDGYSKASWQPGRQSNRRYCRPRLIGDIPPPSSLFDTHPSLPRLPL